jgi:hypothetical protein
MKVKIKIPKMIPRKLLHIAHTVKYGNIENEIIEMNEETWRDENKKFIDLVSGGVFIGMIPRSWYRIVK